MIELAASDEPKKNAFQLWEPGLHGRRVEAVRPARGPQAPQVHDGGPGQEDDERGAHPAGVAAASGPARRGDGRDVDAVGGSCRQGEREGRHADQLAWLVVCDVVAATVVCVAAEVAVAAVAAVVGVVAVPVVDTVAAAAVCVVADSGGGEVAGDARHPGDAHDAGEDAGTGGGVAPSA